MNLPDDHRIVTVGEIVRGTRLLDVGAGACLLEERFDGVYTGVDLTTSVLASGDRRALAGLPHLPFRGGAFDSVVCISVIQYVHDVEGALTELRRVLEPGGQLVVLVPNLGYLRHRVQLARGRLVWSSKLDDWSSGTIRYFTLPDLLPLLSRLELDITDVRCSGRFRRLRSRRPQLLGADLILDLRWRPTAAPGGERSVAP